MALEFWGFLQSRGLTCGSSLLLVHHSLSPLLPVSSKPLKSPYYGLSSVKAQALLGEVDKMLEKGILELVVHLGLGYYSWLFLLATEGDGEVAPRDQLVESEQPSHPHQVQCGDSIIRTRVDQ